LPSQTNLLNLENNHYVRACHLCACFFRELGELSLDFTKIKLAPELFHFSIPEKT